VKSTTDMENRKGKYFSTNGVLFTDIKRTSKPSNNVGGLKGYQNVFNR
jgi:hypothetical protein